MACKPAILNLSAVRNGRERADYAMPHWPDCMEGPQIEDRLDSSGPYCDREIRSRSNNHRPLRSNLRPPPVVGWTAPTSNRRRRSEENTSELPSLLRISSAVFCLQQK